MLGAQRSAQQVTGTEKLVVIKSNHLLTGTQGPAPSSTITDTLTRNNGLHANSLYVPLYYLRVIIGTCVFIPGH